MPVRALRQGITLHQHYKVNELKTMNAREGIKTRMRALRRSRAATS